MHPPRPGACLVRPVAASARFLLSRVVVKPGSAMTRTSLTAFLESQMTAAAIRISTRTRRCGRASWSRIDGYSSIEIRAFAGVARLGPRAWLLALVVLHGSALRPAECGE